MSRLNSIVPVKKHEVIEHGWQGYEYQWRYRHAYEVLICEPRRHFHWEQLRDLYIKRNSPDNEVWLYNQLSLSKQVTNARGTVLIWRQCDATVFFDWADSITNQACMDLERYSNYQTKSTIRMSLFDAPRLVRSDMDSFIFAVGNSIANLEPVHVPDVLLGRRAVPSARPLRTLTNVELIARNIEALDHVDSNADTDVEDTPN